MGIIYLRVSIDCLSDVSRDLDSHVTSLRASARARVRRGVTRLRDAISGTCYKPFTNKKKQPLLLLSVLKPHVVLFIYQVKYCVDDIAYELFNTIFYNLRIYKYRTSKQNKK